MRIYIAGPYGRRQGNSLEECEYNVMQAIVCARSLIKLGHTPFVPVLYHYIHKGWFETLDEDEWLTLCLAWVPHCEALFRLPGYSLGADSEVDLASHLELLIYYNINEVPKVKIAL